MPEPRRTVGFQRHLIVTVLIVVASAAVYWPTLGHEFVFDDVPNVLQNQAIRVNDLSPASWRAAMAESFARNRPVANLTFALNYYFGDYEVRGYRLLNVLIHGLNGILVYWLAWLIFRRLSRDADDGPGLVLCSNAGLAAALIWNLHPVQTQVVIYVVQRMASLATLFFLLAFCLYLVGRQRRDRGRWLLFGLAGLAWALALGSKEIAITLPLLLFLYEWLFLQRVSAPWLQRILKTAAPAAVLLVVLTCLLFVRQDLLRALSFNTVDFSMTERVMTEWRVIVYYLTLLAWPWPGRLVLDYDFTVSTSLLSPWTTVPALLILCGLAAAAVVLARRRQVLVAFMIAWYLINLALESTILPLELVYDHRLYLPSVLVIIGCVWLSAVRLPRQLRLPLAALLVGLLAAGTLVRGRDWQSEIAVWRDCVAKSPQKARPYHNLAVALHMQGRTEEALPLLEEALRLDPEYPEAHVSMASMITDEDLALHHARLGASLNPSPDALNMLGVKLQAQGELESAAGAFRDALKVAPNHLAALANLGAVLVQLSQYQAAEPYLLRALAIDPTLTYARLNLGKVQVQAGQGDAARATLKQVLASDPASSAAYYWLGLLSVREGQVEAAIELWLRSLELAPDSSGTLRYLGDAMYQQQRLPEAVDYYQRSLAIQDNPTARNNLAGALLALRRFDDAIAQYRQILATDPDNAEVQENLRRTLAAQAKQK